MQESTYLVFRSGQHTRLKPFKATFRFSVFHQSDIEDIYHSKYLKTNKIYLRMPTFKPAISGFVAKDRYHSTTNKQK